MEIRTEQSGNVAVLTLEGRLTVADQAGLLKAAVQEALGRGATQVLLDLSGIDYIDSTRLGELIAAYLAVTRANGSFRLVRTPPRVVSLLEMAGLSHIFQYFD